MSDTPTGRAISELAALLREKCPLDALLGAVQKTEDDPLPKPITDDEIERAYQIVWKRLNPGERS